MREAVFTEPAGDQSVYGEPFTWGMLPLGAVGDTGADEGERGAMNIFVIPEGGSVERRYDEAMKTYIEGIRYADGSFTYVCGMGKPFVSNNVYLSQAQVDQWNRYVEWCKSEGALK